MDTVVTMLHGGLHCAISAQQVIFAEGDQVPEGGVRLWEDSSSDDEAALAPRRVRVSTGSGVQWIACSRPRLSELDRERLWPLPEVLEHILGMPYIVGIAEIAGVLHWILDARRLPSAGPLLAPRRRSV